jgi:formylglycine-generating enzyme required for sulfatase activity
VAAGLGLKRQTDERRYQVEATRLVEGLLTANTSQLNTSLASLKKFRIWANAQLLHAFKESVVESDAKLHAGLALVSDASTPDAEILKYLEERLLAVTPSQFHAVRTLLEPHKAALAPVYWELALDEGQPAARRFHAACALAAFDPAGDYSGQADTDTASGWNTPELIPFVAEQLVRVSPVFIGHYQELLRPIAPQLVPALSNIFKDPERGELERTVSTSLLADYASSDPETLTQLLLLADAESDRILFPVLQQHRSAAVKNLETVLDERLEPDWKDAPLDASWTEPSAAVRVRIESAHGLVSERFAFCQDMPLATFLEIAETLRPSGYHPTKIRPYTASLERASGDVNAPLVAAIWTRSNRRWHIDTGLSKATLPLPGKLAEKGDLLLSDISVLPATNESDEPQFITLWSEPAATDEQRRVCIDLTSEEFHTAQNELSEQGFVSQTSIAVRADPDGQRRYTSIWSNQGAPSEFRSAYAGFELVELPQWDIAFAPADTIADPLEKFRRELAHLETQPAEQLIDPAVIESRAVAHYHIGNLEAALADLDSLVEKEITAPSVLQYRTLTLARLQRADEANESLAKYLATKPPLSPRSYIQIVVPAWLGEFEKASELLQSAETLPDLSTYNFYFLARAAAVASQAAAAIDPVQSQKFAQHAMELLRKSVGQGYSSVAKLKADVDFVSLLLDGQFLAFLADQEPPAAYAAVWHADVEFESKLLNGVPVNKVVEELKPLLDQGYRPFAIVGVNDGWRLKQQGKEDSPATAITISNSAATRIVLHRPVITDNAKEQHAVRQAAAAIALLRLNATETVWPLFVPQSAEMQLISHILDRLAPYGVDPQLILSRLMLESDTSSQRALIQGIGEIAQAQLLTAELKSAAIADLTKRYADHPDSGIHGVAEWALRQLQATDSIAAVRTAYSTGSTPGNRRWYLTKTGSNASPSSSIAFAVIQPDDVFLMGSPVSEADRSQGSTGKNEIRHRRHIGRIFAIGMHEITVAQFAAFQSMHLSDRTIAREDDAPANMITWYDAAAYCNWLSEQEGIPPEQWCYNPGQPFEEGMKPVPEYLHLTGYRLPTEAEWEYACRAGATTPYYFGVTESLLDQYAWYASNSNSKGMNSVGRMRPNRFGLFDMNGNAIEWCQEAEMPYDPRLSISDDTEDDAPLENTQRRRQRGGAFTFLSSAMRSANRVAFQPSERSSYFGFRVARTMP